MNPMVTACIDSCRDSTLEDLINNMAAFNSGQVQMKVMGDDGKPMAAVILITEDVQTYLSVIDETEEKLLEAEN